MTPQNDQPRTTTETYTRQAAAVAPGAGTGSFLKWADQEIITLTVTNPKATSHPIHWIPTGSVDCTGNLCPLCMSGNKLKTRWLLEVDAGAGIQTWDMAPQTFSALEEIAVMVGHLKGLTIRVKRAGAGKNTRYTIVPAGPQTKPVPPTDEALTIRSAILNLCGANGIDPQAELKVFMSAADPTLAKAPPLDQLKAYLAHIQLMTGSQKPKEEPTPITGSAVYSMFAPEK